MSQRENGATPAPSNHPSDIAAARHAWEEGPYAAFRTRVPERKERFTTLSGLPVAPLYTPEDVQGVDYLRDVCFPG